MRGSRTGIFSHAIAWCKVYGCLRYHPVASNRLLRDDKQCWFLHFFEVLSGMEHVLKCKHAP